MEIRFIGQSCFFVKKNNTIIVTDPWCKESKAFYGAWIPFPYDDTKFLLDYDFSDKSLYIFLSHEHSDHLDIKLLKKLCNKNKNLNFLLPNFGNHCFNQVKKNFNQHKIIFLNDNEEKEINEVKFRILLEKPLFNEHGACIIEDENTIFVNSNDSVIEDFSIKKDTKKTVIYTGQFSSVSPYPDNSELVQKNQRAKLEKDHLNQQISGFCEGVNNIQANIAIPSSGPVMCIPRKEKIKQMRLTVGQTNGPFDNIFIKKKMEKEIKKNCKIFFLSPSESIKPFKNIVSYNNKFNNKKERLKIFDNLVKLYKFNKIKSKINKSAAKSHLIKFSDKFNKIFNSLEISNDVIFDVIISDIKVFSRFNFLKNKFIYKIYNYTNIKSIFKKIKRPYYSINLSSYHLKEIVENLVPFEELWYGKHISVIEKNKGYNSNIINTLNVMHSGHLANLLISHTKNNERFELSFNQKKYKVKRFCPHKGADLINCKPDSKGIITCPAHGWKISIFKDN